MTGLKWLLKTIWSLSDETARAQHPFAMMTEAFKDMHARNQQRAGAACCVERFKQLQE